MINWIWGGLITIGLLSGVYQELFIPEKAGIMVKITEAAIGAAKTGVDLSLGLIGVMALFLGIMGIAEKAGLIQLLGRIMQPLMVRLFPEVPPDHPAPGSAHTTSKRSHSSCSGNVLKRYLLSLESCIYIHLKSFQW